MPRRKVAYRGHSGRTDRGHTKDLKVKRIGKVTIYKRGLTYYLYYREDGRSIRRSVDGNLATAEATAFKVSAALAEHRPSPLGYQRTSPTAMVTAFLDAATNVQQLALRTQDRYRAALDRFLEYARDAGVTYIDAVTETSVEGFVRWLRGQRRPRNGMRVKKATVEAYATGGIRFILATCRTAFNWAARRRMLPPFTENPFSRFGIDKLRDDEDESEAGNIFTPKQEQDFFSACSDWQRPIFTVLAAYGLRVGELNHLLIEDICFARQVIHIRSKPEMLWRIKTRRRRDLPLTPATELILRQLIGKRKAGFVFLNESFASGDCKPCRSFASDRAFREHLQRIQDGMSAKDPDVTEHDRLKAVTSFCRDMGQIPEKRFQSEFCKLTKQINCPELTRVHDLRHLFATRAQEHGVNPFIVQRITGHESLGMLGRYTHIGPDAQRTAVEAIVASLPTMVVENQDQGEGE